MLKKLAFAASALIFATAGFSQDLPKIKDGYKRKEFNLPSMDQPIIINDSTQRRLQQLTEAYHQRQRAMVQGQTSHRTLNGTVMVLPPDNMPCLVPDNNQLVIMPNANPPGLPPAPMPNAGVYKRKTAPSNR